MNEKTYSKAFADLKANKRDEDLWIKALVLSDGDKEVAQYQYVKLYVEKTEKGTDSLIAATDNRQANLQNSPHTKTLSLTSLSKNDKVKLEKAALLIDQNFVKVGYQSIVKGNSIYDEILNDCFEQEIELFQKLLLEKNEHGEYAYCKNKAKLGKLTENLEKFLNLKGRTINSLEIKENTSKGKDKANILETDKTKASMVKNVINTKENISKEPGRVKYILVWLLFGITSSIASTIVGVTMSNYFGNPWEFISPILSGLVFFLIAISIYSLFEDLIIMKVLPWMWALGGFGLLSSITETYYLAQIMEVKVPLIFVITSIISFVASISAFEWYFKKNKPQRYYH